MSEKHLTFLQHLEELRQVLLRSLWALAGGTAISLVFSPKIFLWLQSPLQRFLPEGSHFIVTTPFESYFAYFRIALVFGLLLASPLIFYFIWSFIRPGLKAQEKRGLLWVALTCGALFISGALLDVRGVPHRFSIRGKGPLRDSNPPAPQDE
jgi:sec-independent protein translocase protein TatC